MLSVGAGCKLVDHSGGTMNEIVVSVRRVADLMGEIAAASTERTLGIAQINQAMGQMDQVTQGNAALVEEAAAAADSLARQAESLKQSVGAFPVSARHRSPPEPRSAERTTPAERSCNRRPTLEIARLRRNPR